MQKPLLIAHRGDRKYFAENTMEAFASALQKGADGIEMDVHLDDAGRLIIVHDYLYDKKKSYPLLADVLGQFAGTGRLEIELKFFVREGINKLHKILEEYKDADIEITSSITPLLPYVKVTMPYIKTGLILQKNLFSSWMTREIIMQYIAGYMHLTNADILHLPLEMYASEVVQLCRQNKWLLHTHLTSANLVEYQRVIELGIDQCTFDDSDLIDSIAFYPF